MKDNQDKSLIRIKDQQHQLPQSNSHRPHSLERTLQTLKNWPKTFHFPPSSVGTLILREQDLEKKYLDFFAHALFFEEETADQVLQARGSITIPGNTLAGLRVNEINQDILKCLSELPANALDALSFFGQSILANELQFIENLKSLRILTLTATNINDRSFEYIRAFPNLEKLYLTDTRVTDLGMEALRDLPALRHFRLRAHNEYNYPITDKTLQILGSRENLQIIFLDNTQITDQGLVTLTNLKQLDSLSLSQNQLTDRSTAILKEFKSLIFLSLAGTQITDRALENLVQLENLSLLDLSDTVVSEEVVVKLYEQLPRCLQILWRGGTYPNLEVLEEEAEEIDAEDYEEEPTAEELKHAQEMLALLDKLKAKIESPEKQKPEPPSMPDRKVPTPENPVCENDSSAVLGWWPT